MKKKSIEDFISENREDFNDQSPSPLIWMNIERQLDRESNRTHLTQTKSTFTLYNIMQVAAMFVVVLGVGLLIGLQINKGQQSIYQSQQLQEFVEAEAHYTSEINEMWTLVNNSTLDDKQAIKNDLNALDAIYQELRNELISNPNADKDYVINAMIENYRTKIDVLQRVLQEYNDENKNNQQIDLTDDKIDI